MTDLNDAILLSSFGEISLYFVEASLTAQQLRIGLAGQRWLSNSLDMVRD